MTTTRPETLLTLNPDGTTSGTRIRRDVYDLLREHLLAVVPDDAEGVALADVTKTLGERLAHVSFNAKGSVTWYTMAVKLDLEGRGRIERVPGKGPQRLRLRNA